MGSAPARPSGRAVSRVRRSSARPSTPRCAGTGCPTPTRESWTGGPTRTAPSARCSCCRACGRPPRWTATAVDLVFGANSQLRALAEFYGAFERGDGVHLTPWDAHITNFTVSPDFTGIGKSLMELRLREDLAA